MNSSARLDDLHQKFEEDARRYFAPLANEYRKVGEPRRAVELCQAQLQSHPGHLSGHVVLGLAFHDLGEREDARRAYSEALRLDPENLLVLRSLGDLAREQGDHDVARDWYERAMGVDPRDPEVARRLALLEQEQEQAPLTASDLTTSELTFTAALAAAESRAATEEADAREAVAPADDRPEGLDGDARPDGDAREQPLAAAHRAVEPGVEESGTKQLADEPDRGVDDGAGFTAGFFATVLDEPSPLADDAAIPPPLRADAESVMDALGGAERPAGATHELAGDEVDRLFADLGSATDELGLGEPTASERREEQAVPTFESSELSELPALEQYHDVVELEEVPAAEHAFAASDAEEGEFPDVEGFLDDEPLPAAAATGLPATGEGPSPADGEAPPAHEPGRAAFGEDDEPLPLVVDDWASLETTLEPTSDEATGEATEPAVDSAIAPAAEDDQAEPASAPEYLDLEPAAWAAEAQTGDEAADAARATAEEPRSDPMPAPAEPGPAALEAPPTPPAAFVTETMAELYLQQGLTTQALGVYRELAAQRPDDRRLAGRVADIEREVAPAHAAGPAPTHGARAGEPPAASWLQKLARARPSRVDMPVVPDPRAVGPSVSAAPAEVAPADVAPVEPSADVTPTELSADVAPEESPARVAPSDPHAPESSIAHDEVGAADEDEPRDDGGAHGEEGALMAGVIEEPEGVELGWFEAEPELRDDASVETVGEQALGAVTETPVAATSEVPDVAAGGAPAADDDPWFFEGERLAAAGSGETAAVGDAPAPGAPADPAPAPAEPLTLDELFARSVPHAEEHAAGALAAATVSLQNDPVVNAQLGEAVAEDPASIQHALRGTPRSVSALRQGASFSFDQFFQVDEPARPEGEKREEKDEGKGRDADASGDLADFHAWLSGLSGS